MIPGMGGLMKSMGDVDHEEEMKRSGRHHRLDDARRAPQPVEGDRPKPPSADRRRGGGRAGRGQRLIKQFDAMADIMKQMATMGMRDRMKAVQQLQQGVFSIPARRPGQGQGRHRQAAQFRGEGAELRKQREKELAAKSNDGQKRHRQSNAGQKRRCTTRIPSGQLRPVYDEQTTRFQIPKEFPRRSECQSRFE